jgi:hypothetical protein
LSPANALKYLEVLRYTQRQNVSRQSDSELMSAGRRLIKDRAESVFVVTQPEAMAFGKQLDLKFASLAIVRPNPT